MRHNIVKNMISMKNKIPEHWLFELWNWLDHYKPINQSPSRIELNSFWLWENCQNKPENVCCELEIKYISSSLSKQAPQTELNWGEAIIKLTFSLLDSSLLTLTRGAGWALSMVTTNNNKTRLNLIVGLHLSSSIEMFRFCWTLIFPFPNFPFSKLFQRIFIAAF